MTGIRRGLTAVADRLLDLAFNTYTYRTCRDLRRWAAAAMPGGRRKPDPQVREETLRRILATPRDGIPGRDQT